MPPKNHLMDIDILGVLSGIFFLPIQYNGWCFDQQQAVLGMWREFF